MIRKQRPWLPVRTEIVCKKCGKKLPATDAFFRPRRKGDHIHVLTCRECEAAIRRVRRKELKKDPNSLRDPNGRIVVEYVPEWIDDLEIAAMQAADEVGAEFVDDDRWEEFLNVLTRLARRRRVIDRAAMKELAVMELPAFLARTGKAAA